MMKTAPIARRGRPARSGRDSHETKQLLLQSGVEYFTEFGFSGSGIDQILKKVSVPKGSFYHYFASKEAFGLAVIDQYHQYFADKLDSHLLDSTLTPLSRMMQFADDAKAGMERYGFSRGCLVGNLEQEVALLPESHRLKLLAVYDIWQQKIAQCLMVAQQQGEIAALHNCHALAQFFWLGWEGAIAKCKLSKNVEPIDGFMQLFMQLITQKS